MATRTWGIIDFMANEFEKANVESRKAQAE